MDQLEPNFEMLSMSQKEIKDEDARLVYINDPERTNKTYAEQLWSTVKNNLVVYNGATAAVWLRRHMDDLEMSLFYRRKDNPERPEGKNHNYCGWGWEILFIFHLRKITVVKGQSDVVGRRRRVISNVYASQVPVKSILDEPEVDWSQGFDFSWEDETADPLVDEMVRLIFERFEFKKEMFVGGLTSVELARLRLENKNKDKETKDKDEKEQLHEFAEFESSDVP
ncbi:hypothetical protein Bca52824_027190 [Brassica carinata]|uniref:Uncharacterized protein n=1 Tax=Brassica carinata TaxID=52824 RepID=A0A8X7V9L5_BRACI|nr:hypothetical protein Bca52824_027190 [Brassica carinata]